MIGFDGYATGNSPFSYTTTSSRRFLAVIGNDPHVATRTLVIKSNTFVGYSNEESGAVDPWILTTVTDVGPRASQTMSWAGCFWKSDCC